VRKIKGCDAGTMYAMKVLKKATLKGDFLKLYFVARLITFDDFIAIADCVLNRCSK